MMAGICPTSANPIRRAALCAAALVLTTTTESSGRMMVAAGGVVPDGGNGASLPAFARPQQASMGGAATMAANMKLMPGLFGADIRSDSHMGTYLMQHARRLEDDDANNDADGDDGNMYASQNIDFSFIASYSMKFQGCHHISQWNDDADDEDEVRIQTKRLVRFRLCPTSSCSDSKSSGCTAKYGDYIVDMETFVYAYLRAQSYELQDKCDNAKEACYDVCNNNDDYDSCNYECYANYGLSYCVQGDGSFSPSDYSQCAQYNFGGYNNNNGDDQAAAQDDDAAAAADDDGGRRQLADDAYNNANYEYYVGPYCADQGGAIHLGLFTDNTCTTFANGGASTFQEKAGFELPFSSDSLISYECLDCADQNYANYGDDGDNDAQSVRDLCQSMYAISGKCENKMSNMDNGANDNACTYIEGVKIIRNDGVIRTHSVRKSKAASIVIGLFTTLAVLLGAYVFYLRNKLGRAKINLASQG